MKKKLLFLFIGMYYINTQAQTTNTWDIVYNIFQAKCASCHGGATNAGQLNLSLASGTVYAAIINKTPVNPAAASRGDKVILPGDGHRSFLLRKCQNGLDSDNGIVAAEGNVMPNNGTNLSKQEIETIRQWILYGAKQTGVAVDTAVINKYYKGKAINVTNTLVAPPAGQGFQIHYGPVMLPPKTEVENFLKYDPKLPDSLEINRLDCKINKRSSHHFIIYKFLKGDDANYSAGLRPLNNRSASQMVTAWQTSLDEFLPTGTAYQWPKYTILDLNLHCFNTNADSVLMNDSRINIYTQPYGTAQAVMYSELATNNFFSVPNGSVDVPITLQKTWPQLTTMYIWALSSHTHKYGVDYDIYKRLPGGGKDAANQLFEGFYNFSYTFNQGYYDWEDPAVENFVTGYPINPKDGLYAEAHYKNTGPATVFVGQTTSDEMMLFFINYTTKQVTTGINTIPREVPSFNVFPNPANSIGKVNYQLQDRSFVNMELYNLLGSKISTLVNEMEDAGLKTQTFDAKASGFIPGIYLLKLSINGVSTSQKLVVTE